MENVYFEQSKKKKEPVQPEKSFWQETVTFTENGKLKSLDLLYAMVLGFVLLFFYFGVQHFATLWFEDLFTGMSRAWLNVVDIALPAVLCTAVLCAIEYFLKKKNVLTMAFFIALLMQLIVIVYILFAYPAELRALILPAIVYMLFLPTLFGTAATVYEAYLLTKKRAAQKADA